MGSQSGLDYGKVEYSLSNPPSGRNSLNEQRRMLENMTIPTRLTYGSNIPNAASSSTNPRPRYPSNSMDPTSPLVGSEADPRPNIFRMQRSGSTKSMPPSPLNPAYQYGSQPSYASSPFARPRSQTTTIARIASEETRALTGPASILNNSGRGSMILYRPAELPSLPSNGGRRQSVASTSTDYYLSLSSDSKYPVGLTKEHGLVAYAYDPLLDESEAGDEEDALHEPDVGIRKKSGGQMSWRGLKNFGMLGVLIAAFMTLFVGFPVIGYFRQNNRNALIVGNTKINATGQAESPDKETRSQIPISVSFGMIDPRTPRDAMWRRTSWRGEEYKLVFSDEFETEGRTFVDDDDEFWVAGEDASYDPRLITTRDGHLVIRLDTVRPEVGNSSRLFAGSVLRQRSPLCMEGGYVEMSVVLPEMDTPTLFYWSSNSWSAGDEMIPSIPENGISRFLQLQMTIGSAGSNPSRPHHRSPTSKVMLVDYVRFYSRANQRRRRSCIDIRHPQHVDFPPDIISPSIFHSSQD